MASLIFNWKCVEAESRILKQSSEHRERQFSKPLKCLKIWECLLEARCSRMRLTQSPTPRYIMGGEGGGDAIPNKPATKHKQA